MKGNVEPLYLIGKEYSNNIATKICNQMGYANGKKINKYVNTGTKMSFSSKARNKKDCSSIFGRLFKNRDSNFLRNKKKSFCFSYYA